MTDRMDPEKPIYVISIAAELAGVHPQTLRVYERKGLVAPKRTSGNSRRYSERDIQLLRRIQQLTNEGINLAGVLRILELEAQVARLRSRFERAADQIGVLEDQLQQSIDTRSAASLVPLRDVRRVRRAMKSDVIEQMSRRRTFTMPGTTQTNRTIEPR
jgi:MerR family transcriptional regulator/heat shock protein HspR